MGRGGGQHPEGSLRAAALGAELPVSGCTQPSQLSHEQALP